MPWSGPCEVPPIRRTDGIHQTDPPPGNTSQLQRRTRHTLPRHPDHLREGGRASVPRTTLERCITDKGRDRLAQLRAAT